MGPGLALEGLGTKRTPYGCRACPARAASPCLQIISSRCARRGRHVERDLVLPGYHRQAVGSYLVGHVAVGGDPVGADDDGLHLTAADELSGRRVGEKSRVDPGAGKLPGRQARALH